MILNLATNPFENRRRFLVLSTMGGSLLVVTTLLLGGLFIRNWRGERGLARQESTLRQEVARLDQEQKRLEAVFERPEVVDVVDRSQFLNSLIRQKAVSWTQLFMDLEKLMPERVQVSSLRPVVKDASKIPPGVPLLIDLQMDVSAENFSALLELMRRVEKSEKFHQPEAKIETPPQGGGPQDALYRGSIRVTYVQR